MITEDYVSFEVAKLLKDKGFNEPTIGTYNIESKNPILVERPIRAIHCEAIISAPTLQMAMKWLREVYNIHIVPIHVENKNYRVKINGLSIFELDNPSIYLYGKYEYVIDFAIKYALEHLI